MPPNYLKIQLRNLLNDKAYAVLNITGLSLGIACFIILALYLRHELTFDQHNTLHERIYRLNHEIDYGNTNIRRAQSSHYLAPRLATDYPQIESYVSFRRASRISTLFEHENNSYYMDDVYIADNSVFEIFSHDIIYGNPNQALTQPNTIAISESVSRQYFGADNPVGKMLTNTDSSYQVTLVFADLPDNTHFKYSVLLANQGMLSPAADESANRLNNLWNLNAYNYLLMHEGYEPANSDGEEFDDFFDRVLAEFTRPGYRARFYLEPLAGIHLNSTSQRDEPRGNTYYLYAFSAVALFVLLIACTNYVNLATARANRRSREISIRKILGADKRTLVAQFLSESIVYSLLALAIAISIVEFLLSGTAEVDLFGKNLSLNFWQDSLVFLSLLSLGLIVGIVAGAYPAFYLATTNTNVQHFRGWRRSLNSVVREGLVFVQFTISIAVITATTLMYLQMKYIEERPLGFDKQNKIIIPIQGVDAIEGIQVLMDQLKTNPQIISASLMSGNPITNRFNPALEALREDGTVYNLDYHTISIDGNFIDTMGLSLVAGRGFEVGAEPIATNAIINQAVADELGWEDPIGKTYTIGGDGPYTVIGMVEDFHFSDMHQAITAFVFYPDLLSFEGLSQTQRAGVSREMMLDITGESLNETLDFIQDRWNEFDGAYPFQYEFLADQLEQLYVSDNQQMSLIGIFAAISIFISCLGLFGLTAFTTSQRTKEIGIRKTLGATTHELILMLFRNILSLLLLASVIASLIAYFGINGWLQGFYYRDAINPMAFAFAGLLSIGIAFFTLTAQSIKTVMQNPVEALRYE